MGKIVNTNEVRKTATNLGWDSLNLSELGDWIKDTGIPSVEVLNFMDALVASPKGLDDSGITGITAGNLPYIEEFFRGKGLVF